MSDAYEIRKIAHRHALKIVPLQQLGSFDLKDAEIEFCSVCNRKPDRGEVIGWSVERVTTRC